MVILLPYNSSPRDFQFLEMYISFTVNCLVLFMASWVILTDQWILQAVLKNVYQAVSKLSGERELPNMCF